WCRCLDKVTTSSGSWAFLPQRRQRPSYTVIKEFMFMGALNTWTFLTNVERPSFALCTMGKFKIGRKMAAQATAIRKLDIAKSTTPLIRTGANWGVGSHEFKRKGKACFWPDRSFQIAVIFPARANALVFNQQDITALTEVYRAVQSLTQDVTTSLRS